MSEQGRNNHEIDGADRTRPPASGNDARGLFGPTLMAADPEERPRPPPACATCPKAMWYRTAKHGLRAFCRELRLLSWQVGDDDPVTECDGREATLHEP